MSTETRSERQSRAPLCNICCKQEASTSSTANSCVLPHVYNVVKHMAETDRFLEDCKDIN
eukprot:scaffold45855_cov350-Skeletonema_marinoi.AAC.1